MNTKDLLSSLRSCPNTKKHSLGVFAADTLPRNKIKKFPAALICNSDVSTEPGTHWLAFYFPRKNGIGEFFDPYGHPPEYYSDYFTRFLQTNSSRWIYNQRSVQAPMSWVCGSHCLFYLKLRCAGLKMQHIVTKYYTSNVLDNDVKVSLNTHVTYCTPKECANMQKCIPIVK
jgi:hypothetical protein